MAVQSYDSIGSVQDTVSLEIGDTVIRDALSYEVACSVFSQPAAFALTFGWGGTAEELIARFPKGTPFKLKIAGSTIQSGRIDAIGCSGATTNVTVRGRDMMSELYRDTFIAEKAFSEATYYQLTRKMLDAVGLQSATLTGDNTANRKAVTGHQVVETAPTFNAETLEIEQQDPGGARKIVYNQIRSHLGERRYAFLQRHYEKAGLFLWATGDGNFVLARPTGDQRPGYSIVRGRKQTRNEVNVEDISWEDDASERYAKTIVYGQYGAGKAGRAKARGEWIDEEMVRLGFGASKTIKDDQIKSDKQAQFAARRDCAMQIRNGWRLEYTLAGHLMPSLYDVGAWAIWAPDTVCSVDDQELGLKDDYYVSDVNFTREMGAGTRTRVKLMRRDGLIFGES